MHGLRRNRPRLLTVSVHTAGRRVCRSHLWNDLGLVLLSDPVPSSTSRYPQRGWLARSLSLYSLFPAILSGRCFYQLLITKDCIQLSSSFVFTLSFSMSITFNKLSLFHSSNPRRQSAFSSLNSLPHSEGQAIQNEPGVGPLQLFSSYIPSSMGCCCFCSFHLLFLHALPECSGIWSGFDQAGRVTLLVRWVLDNFFIGRK